MLLGVHSPVGHQTKARHSDFNHTPGRIRKMTYISDAYDVITHRVQSQKSAPEEDSLIVKSQINGNCFQMLCSEIHRSYGF